MITEAESKDPEPFVEMTGNLRRATLHSGLISPVFGDIAAKMGLAIDQEVQRLLAIGVPIIVDRGNGIEALYALPDE